MMRTRTPPMLAERVRPVPTLRTGAGRHLVMRRLCWRVDFVSVFGFVVAVRQKLCFIGFGAKDSAQFLGPGLLGRRCDLVPR